MNLSRKRHKSLSILLSLAVLGGCTTSNTTVSPAAAPVPDAQSAASGSLASLLTGQVVSSEEQQLRDIQKRQILLDFPIKIGVVNYNLQSKLEAQDFDSRFVEIQTALKASGLVSETIRIPSALVGNAVTVENLRRLGARFQCDVLILMTGAHSFNRAAVQNLSFFDSFSDKVYFESQIHFEAIALDVFTGVLLNPFDTATKSGPYLLDRAAADFAAQRYRVEQEAETKAWQALLNKALENLKQLKSDVEKRRASLAQSSPQPSSSPSPIPSGSPSAVASPSPQASASPSSSPQI